LTNEPAEAGIVVSGAVIRRRGCGVFREHLLERADVDHLSQILANSVFL
jgi:hypothetical protein